MEQLDLRIFDLSPMPMWIQDYSGVKKIFEEWNAQGILDIRAYLLEDPSRLLPALATIKTLMVNRSTLKLYEANNLDEILESFSKFHFPEITVPQVIFFTALLEQDSDCMFAPINYTCTGKQIDVQLRANIINGYEDTWEKILFTTLKTLRLIKKPGALLNQFSCTHRPHFGLKTMLKLSNALINSNSKA